MNELEASIRELVRQAVEDYAAKLRLLPITVHQNTVEGVIGISSRSYLEELRKPGFPLDVIRQGKLRIVNTDAFMDYLRQKSKRVAKVEAPKRERDESDAMLEDLGIEVMPRRSSGRARRAA